MKEFSISVKLCGCIRTGYTCHADSVEDAIAKTKEFYKGRDFEITDSYEITKEMRKDDRYWV